MSPVRNRWAAPGGSFRQGMAGGAALALQHFLPAPDFGRRLEELQGVKVGEQILPVRFGSGRRHDALRRKFGPHRRGVIPQLAGQSVRTIGRREARAQVAGDLGSLVPEALPANGVALLAALLPQDQLSIPRIGRPHTTRGSEEYDPSKVMRDRHRRINMQFGGHGAERGRRIIPLSATHLRRLGRGRALLPVQPRRRLLLQVARAVERRRILPLRPQRPVVAGRDLHGRDHLRRRYAAGGHRNGRGQRDRRQLAVVVLRLERHADGVLLRAPVAALGRHDRRRIRRDPLLRKARGLPARIPRIVPGHPDQLHHPRLGQQGHGGHPDADPGGHQARSPGDRDRADRADVVHLDAVRTVGRAGHGSVPVRDQDGHGDRAGGVRRAGRGRHRGDEAEAVADRRDASWEAVPS